MSRRREVMEHMQQLGEIRDIMKAMKNLALMETRKFASCIDAQRQVFGSVEAVAADFLDFHPLGLFHDPAAGNAYLLIGSERGFCGDFNEVLLDHLAAERPAPAEHTLLVFGRKLGGQLEDDPRVRETLAGPSVVEEVPEVLNRLIAAIGSLRDQPSPPALVALYHDGDGVQRKTLLPPFEGLAREEPDPSLPPVLNLSPEQFLSALIDHYLFAVLNAIFLDSLMAENQQRVEHMEGALSRLDETMAQLARRSNSLRQEAIIEEIEVILLSTGQRRRRE